MEYHSFIDSEGRFVGKTKYTSGELIPLPPEGIMNDIRFINHKWRCILPKIKQEKAYDEFYLSNLKNFTKIDDTLLQLEVFCKKNKIMPELKIKEKEFNDLAAERQKTIIKSMIEYGFDDIVFTNTDNKQVKCRNFLTYNYNTKRREYNKIYFRRNVKYDLDLKFDISIGSKIDFREMNYQAKIFDKNQNENEIKVEIELPDIGCNANCWYCRQYQKNTKQFSNDASIINEITETIEKIKSIAKEYSLNIRFSFLGGELSILSNSIQKKLVNIINELIEEDYPCFIFTNGILKDAPILNINKVRYVIHAIDWKNKTLPKLKDKDEYIIVFTERDTEEDIDNFFKLNPDIKYFPFTPEKNLKTNTLSILKKRCNIKFRDKRHQIYYCRREGFCWKVRHMTIEIKNNGEKNVYYCCAFKNKTPFKDLKNFYFPDIICPKNCNGV